MPAQFESINSPIVREPVVSNGVPYSLDDDIVITGLSGRFPESSNVEEFKQNLLDGIDMVTDDERRWARGLHGLPARSGKLKDLSKFDAIFFGVHAKQANAMDPQLRMLLELTYEAIVDAGINPSEIRGSRTGVFIGSSSSETEDYWNREPERVNGYGLVGCCRAMFANRISYTFDFTGPSFAMDTACSSSMFALHQAIVAMRSGQCDAAIVGGVNLLLKATNTLQFHRLNMLSDDGKCKVFDATGNGYVRAEAASAIFLQKSKDARRVYATVVNSKVNTDGYKVQGVTYPNGEMQNQLMREVYAESGINPADVAFVEAHGTGTKVGDPQETNSIASLFCKDRKTPLLIGSVKSNMGHSEPASGLCSIAKMLIAMECGVLPPNLHYITPNPDIPSLSDGRLQVVDKPTPWKGGLVAINSFGFGGANAHVILRSNPKPKLSPVLETKLPKLVAVSGRTEEAVNCMLDKVKEVEEDDEFIALMHDIHAENIPGHGVRGFQILGDINIREVDQFSSEKRPIWFIFSGMGSQWAGMGQEMLRVETFERSIRRCADALKPEGIDLMDLLLNPSEEDYMNVIYSFVSIAAVQVALVDVLTSLDIQPDGILGHSVGEVACAYADGTFTPEQTVLAAYWRGRSIAEGKVIRGAMAAVGLSWEETAKRCPPDICPACHNAADSVTISGPAESVEKFVEQLQKEEIFARKVKCPGIAFHSKYIAQTGPKLRAALEKIIPNPKPRSSRWISSSIPESAWGSPLAQLSSAAYHVNNLLSPVLFQEGLAHIPENAIIIEIAPHCLLQAILRRSLPSTVTNICLQKRDHSNNLAFFLSNIGKLYTSGAQPKISKLYPPVTYPVGRGTPMINSLVKWDHSIEWTVANFGSKSGQSGECVVEINLAEETNVFLAGHTIDGRILFPATGYLVNVWKIFAKLHGTDFDKLPIVFENVQFQRATIVPKEGSVKLLVNIFEGSGEFEISENGSTTVTGKIRISENIEKEQLNLPIPVVRQERELLELDTKDVYKDLKLRGYEYTGIFQGIKSCDNRGISGKLLWFDNWISYLDTMLQFCIIGVDTRELYLPTHLQYASINPTLHKELLEKVPEGDGLPVYNYPNIKIVKSGGIEIRGVKTSLAPRKQLTQAPPIQTRYTFVPYDNSHFLVEDPDKAKLHAVTVLVQLVMESNPMNIKLKVAEVAGERSAESLLAPTVMKILVATSLAVIDMQVLATSTEMYNAVLDNSAIKAVSRDVNTAQIGQDLHLVVAADVLSSQSSAILKNMANSLKSGGFVILEETGNFDTAMLKNTGFIFIARQTIPGKTYILLKKYEVKSQPIVIQITEKNFSWVEGVKAALRKAETENQQVLLVSQGEELLGVVGMVNCIRREPGGTNVRYVFIQDKNAPKFSLNTPFYTEQLDKLMTANVLKGGQWGTYRHLLLEAQKDVSSLHVEHAFINTLIRGDLTSLRWIEGPLSYYQPEKFPNSELCSVYYAPLNFRDVMLATGKLQPDALPGKLATEDCILGFEFSGRDTKGRRVMGMVRSRGLATTVIADPGFLWEVPDKWTLEQAATVPVVYSTSYYALIVRGGLKPGETVLIHAGTGGVGQASISIALHMGCKVFTTVGSQEKREFLKKTFPQLTDRNIGNSRDTSFEQLILSETEGRGVDVVLNSLADEKLQASVRCLARDGRFLEIGKYDLSNNSPLGMGMFLKNTCFHGILLDALFDGDSPTKKEIVRLVYEGIKNGAVRPLLATVFSDQQIEQGFRYMATGKHIGKVVLKIREEEPQKVVLPTPKTVAAIPRTYMNPDKSYILVGGLGGFGMELANWMISRGARYIVLTSRSGIRRGYQSLCVRRWREMGVNVVISTRDVTTLAGTELLIKETNKLAPVGGIFNLAAVLRDALLVDLDEAKFKEVSLPKIDATKHLDAVSRKHCPSLDYFVIFSSISSGIGNMGQTNYGFANSAMERIVEQRQANGLPGLGIQWGGIGDVGLVAEMLGDNDTVVGGTVPQRLVSCLATFDTYLQQPHPVLSSYLLVDIHKPTSANELSVADAVANILGIKDIKTVNVNNTLADLGMDSLMGTEIKQTLERNYDLVLSAQEIRNLTFAKLIELTSASTETPEQPANAAPVKTTDDLLFHITGNEIIPRNSIVQLQTKSFEGTPLFLIHAIEGLISAFKPLASELERPAWGIQCTPDTPLDSIQDSAKFYINEIKKIQKEGPYHLAGYSFGACIAFEMAVQLEAAGEEVVLTVLDGSPQFVKLHTKMIGKQADENLILDGQQKSLAFFVRQFNPDISFTKAFEILKETRTQEEMLNKMVELIGNTPFQPEDLKLAGLLLYKKLRAANLYEPTDKFSGEIMLMKAKDTFVALPNDFGLSEICKQDIKIEELAGNHRDILVGESVKKIAHLLRV